MLVFGADLAKKNDALFAVSELRLAGLLASQLPKRVSKTSQKHCSIEHRR